MKDPLVWVILAGLALVLFGAKRLPDAARGLGRSLRVFKAEVKGLTEDDRPQQAAAPGELPTAQAPYQPGYPPAGYGQPPAAGSGTPGYPPVPTAGSGTPGYPPVPPPGTPPAPPQGWAPPAPYAPVPPAGEAPPGQGQQAPH